VWLASEWGGISSNAYRIILEALWADADAAATNAVRAALEGWEEDNLGTYLTIEIPLGGAWDNYEIKGSTNNFTNYCYYFISYAVNSYSVTGDGTYTTADDTNAWVYYTDDFNADPVGVLRWHKMVGNSDLGSQFANNLTECEKVVHCVSKDCDYPAARWQDPTNPNLVFSYIRVDGVDVEMNASDTLQHWSLIPPSSITWSKSRPDL